MLELKTSSQECEEENLTLEDRRDEILSGFLEGEFSSIEKVNNREQQHSSRLQLAVGKHFVQTQNAWKYGRFKTVIRH